MADGVEIAGKATDGYADKTEEEKANALEGTYADFKDFLGEAQATAEMLPNLFKPEYWEDMYENMDWNYFLSGEFLAVGDSDQFKAVVLVVGAIAAAVAYLVSVNWIVSFDTLLEPADSPTIAGS